MKFNIPAHNYGPFTFTWKTEWYEDSTEELQKILRNKDADKYMEAVNKLYENDPEMPIKITNVYSMDGNCLICQLQTRKTMTIKQLQNFYSILTGETPKNIDLEIDVV